ncbi:cold-shock protein [Sneathiella sp.]|uniref:cold-shock protein n=1 Tax=Sneathiella sp. TaxID=1964365 RepID=UPI00356B24F2
MGERNNAAALPTGMRESVKCKVKWFNTMKGFGFVEPLDGSDDGFVHISVLQSINLQGLPEGALITCDLYTGERGMQVSRILDLGPAPVLQRMNDDGELVAGTVKFFNPQKGFGFVTPDDGGDDIFVHMKILEKSGLANLVMAQRVRLNVSNGEKGPTADGVEIIPI